jgi:hypothetical protein
MGSMSFLLPKPLPDAAAATLSEACIASTVGYYDQTPGPTKAHISGNCLTLSRTPNESGYLLLPWPVEPFGSVMVTSTTLRERPEPYRLLVELARGKLNQVRAQAVEWQGMGLRTSDDFDRALNDATRQFGLAALAGDPAEADAAASRVLVTSHHLADRLAREFIEQMFATRHDEEGVLDTWLTARHHRPLGAAAAAEYKRSFNAANVCFRWGDVEPHETQFDWTQADAAVSVALDCGLPVTIGPIIDLGQGMLPPWAETWSADLPALAAFMCDYLETVVSRYKHEVRRWIVCAGFDNSDAVGLNDDDRLRLAFRLFEAASQVDPNLELILSVAQPWGDYLVSEEQTISPLTFPDDLVRAGVRLKAIELELRMGTRPRGSLPRDLIDTARLFETFGMLGPPLEVLLSFPASGEPDPNAKVHGQEVWTHGWPSGPSAESQAEWGAAMASLALCWPKVRSVTWDNWSDADPHLVPHGGLLDAGGNFRPLLARLRALRTEHLASPR